MSEQPQSIQGQKPGSKNEANFAVACDRLKVAYQYQYAILGGRSRRGGYVLDFLLTETAPEETAVNIQGEYWHKEGSKEDFERYTIEDYCRRHHIRYVEVTEEETATLDAAIKKVKELK